MMEDFYVPTDIQFKDDLRERRNQTGRVVKFTKESGIWFDVSLASV